MFTRRHLRPITLKISHTSSRAQSFTFFCILVVLFVTSSRSRVQTPLSNDGESRRRVENEMTFLAFLLLFLFSSSSSSTGTTRAAMEETTNLINDPFQSTSCRDAQMYCEQTITPAIEQDSTLKQFLRDERKEAKRTQSWESVVPEERMKQMKVPETLALGKFGVGVGVLLLCFAF